MDRMSPEASTVENVDVGPLSSSLGFLLRMAQLRIYEDFFGAGGDQDLKPGTFSVLSIIGGNPGIRQGVLAQRLKIKPAHMTKLIRNLEDKGLLMRSIPDQDRRAVELTLSAEGQAFVERNWAAFTERDERGARHLTVREREELARLLRKFTGLDQGDAG